MYEAIWDRDNEALNELLSGEQLKEDIARYNALLLESLDQKY